MKADKVRSGKSDQIEYPVHNMHMYVRCLPAIIAMLFLSITVTQGQKDNTLNATSTFKITEEERAEMLEKHNSYRMQHNATALEMDEEASMAKRFVVLYWVTIQNATKDKKRKYNAADKMA